MLFSLRKFHLSVHIHVLNFVHMFLFDCLSPFYVLCHVCSSFMEEIKNTTTSSGGSSVLKVASASSI